MTYSKPAMPSEDLEQWHDIRITHTKHMIYMMYVSPDMFLSAKLRRLTGLLYCIFGRLKVTFWTYSPDVIARRHEMSIALLPDSCRSWVLRRELTETASRPADRPANARKIKSAGRRGNIGPSAGLAILDLTEPADGPAVARPMLRFFEHTQSAASRPIS